MTIPRLRLMLAGVASLTAIVAVQALPAGQAAPGAITPSSVIKLFDGKSLENFQTWLVDHHESDPQRVFSVVDQIDGAPAIRISGQVWGGLLTKQAYRDYRLVAEFRWGGATWGDRKARARDSGILLHAQGRLGNTKKDFNGPWLRSVEFQIIEGGVGDILPVLGLRRQRRTDSAAVTARETKDRDGENGVRPQRRAATRCRRAASTGGAAARTGRTRSDSAARRTSRRPASAGPASKRWWRRAA